MRHARLLGFAGLTVAAAAAVAFAQSTVTPLPDAPPVQTAPLDAAVAQPVNWGDPKNGATLAATCAACHGLNGLAVLPNYPSIAGHGERYIAEQLALFKSGERSAGQAALMRPFALRLSPQDMRDLGAHYSTQKPSSGLADDSLITDENSPYQGQKFYEPGERLYFSGDAERGIPACMACHGPSGAGNPGSGYPHIAGQTDSYVVQRLTHYRDGTSGYTNPTRFEIMAQIAESLTDEEIASLGSFMSGLHDRADEATAEQLAALGPLPSVPAITTPPAVVEPVTPSTQQAPADTDQTIPPATGAPVGEATQTPSTEAVTR